MFQVLESLVLESTRGTTESQGLQIVYERQVAAKYTVYLSLPHREESDNHMVSVKEEPNYCCCPSPL